MPYVDTRIYIVNDKGIVIFDSDNERDVGQDYSKGYSEQPRGCSHAYMCYYLEHFDRSAGQEQWELFKKHMGVTRFGVPGFREYLPS